MYIIHIIFVYVYTYIHTYIYVCINTHKRIYNIKEHTHTQTNTQIWACVNSGNTLIDAMVVQMSHRTKEGYGKQRMWGAVAMGGMSIVSGGFIDAVRGLYIHVYVCIYICVMFVYLCVYGP